MPPAGYVTNDTDCLDTNDTVYPGAAEICDELDNDCDSTIDEGVQTTYYQDSDSDNYGNVSVTTGACSAPVGFTGNSADCLDTNDTVYPGAAEICDELDNDCDFAIDEGVQTTYYQDSDSDDYGNPSVTTGACSVPVGYTGDNTDCLETNDTVYPGAAEICDELDNDCDATVDEGVQTTYYEDSADDNYGNISVTTGACSAPVGFTGDATDCVDTNDTIYPGAAEICDVLDNDCDLEIDEGIATDTYYPDADDDGFGELYRRARKTLDGGNLFTCGISSDKSVRCWGDNASLQQ